MDVKNENLTKEQVTTSIGYRIDYLAKIKKLTNQQIANDIGIDHDSISVWRLGKRAPNAFALIKLCQYFEVSADFMLGFTDKL